MTEQNELEGLYREAQAALKAKEYDRAAGLLTQILVINAEHNEARQLMAEINRDAALAKADQAEKAGRWDTAIIALKEYLSLKPGDALIQKRLDGLIEAKHTTWLNAIVMRADQAVADQNWEEAIDVLNEVLALEDDNAEIQRKVASVQEARRVAEDATWLEHKKQWVARRPLWGIGVIAFAVLTLIVWGLASLPASPTPTQTPSVTQTLSVEPATKTPLPAITEVTQPTETPTQIDTDTPTPINIGVPTALATLQDGVDLISFDTKVAGGGHKIFGFYGTGEQVVTITVQFQNISTTGGISNVVALILQNSNGEELVKNYQEIWNWSDFKRSPIMTIKNFPLPDTGTYYIYLQSPTTWELTLTLVTP